MSIDFFYRFFQRTNTTLSSELGSAEEGTSVRQHQPVASHSMDLGASSSNNILNSNLSGSFHRCDDTTDDENILVTSRQNKSTPNISNRCESSDNRRNNRPIASSSTGRIGVAAIPNNSFNPSPPISRGRSNMIL